MITRYVDGGPGVREKTEGEKEVGTVEVVGKTHMGDDK